MAGQMRRAAQAMLETFEDLQLLADPTKTERTMTAVMIIMYVR